MNGKKRSKIRRCLSAVALAVSMFACSLTALAYEDVHNVITDEELFVTEINSLSQKENLDFAEAWLLEDGNEIWTSEVANEEMDMIEILYDEQFIDEDGNVYEVNTEVQPYEACNHELKSGTYTRHLKYTDGHCEVQYYNAEWCVHCGDIWVHNLVKTVTYTTCPH